MALERIGNLRHSLDSNGFKQAEHRAGGNRTGVDLEGRGDGDNDQNTMYEILNELIKVLKRNQHIIVTLRNEVYSSREMQSRWHG